MKVKVKVVLIDLEEIVVDLEADTINDIENALDKYRWVGYHILNVGFCINPSEKEKV